MSDVLFMHSPNLHEAYRLFTNAINTDFMPAYHRNFRELRYNLIRGERVMDNEN